MEEKKGGAIPYMLFELSGNGTYFIRNALGCLWHFFCRSQKII